MKKFFIAFSSIALIPAVAIAQLFDPTYPDTLITQTKTWLGTAVTILMILMTLWFLWAVFKFIGEKDPNKVKERKQQVMNGLIGLFIAVAVWGIIRLAQNVFGLNGTVNNAPNIPCPPGYKYNRLVGECRPI